jgi:alpha-L-rhamnosidase
MASGLLRDTMLTPGWTDFHKRVLYQTYDVTSLLQRGENTLGVVLAGGWYSSPMTWAGYPGVSGAESFAGAAGCDVERWQPPGDCDGSVVEDGGVADYVCGDLRWRVVRCAAGAGWVERAALRCVQVDGMRLWGLRRIAGWQVTAQPDLSIRTTLTLHPIAIDPANAAHPAVLDMGQNMVGDVRLHVRGPRGLVVKLRYAERLNPDGSIYTTNLRNADATDTYVLSGKGEETWTPKFTFHGFRYVEISI